MRDKRRQPYSECLGVLLLLLLVVYPMFFMSIVNGFDDNVKMQVGHSVVPNSVGNLTENSRNKRAILKIALAVGTGLDIGVKLITLTNFATGNIRQIMGSSEEDKNHQEIVAHFEQIQMELEQQTEELQSINQEIKNLGLSIIYFEHEDKIIDSVWTLLDYLEHPNERSPNHFIEKAVHLDKSIRILVDGLLGKHTFSHDIMAVMRDAVKCDSRKLRENIRSVGSFIIAGLYVRGQYKRITNATEGDSSPFKKYIGTSLPKLKTRLDDMVIKCQADERNVSNEMRKIMETTLTPNRQNITNALLKFLEEKYDTKKWIVLVQEKSWEKSVRTGRFHQASVRNDVAFAISVDPRGEENVPGFENLIDKSLKDFKIPCKCHEDRCECHWCHCLSSFEIETYLNRILIPIRNDGIELATLIASSDYELPHFIVATSQGVMGNRFNSKSTNDMVYAKNNQFMNYGRCYHWVIVIAISFSLDRLSDSPLCHYDPDQTIQDYGPLRNEHAQAYLSVEGDSRKEGASIILDGEWRNSPGQKWKFVDGQLRNGFGNCLTAWKSLLSISDTVYFYQYSCHHYWSEQRWHRHGLQIINDKKTCLTFDGKVHQDPMYVKLLTCRALSSYYWYNRDTDCEDALAIPSTTNGSRPLRNEFSRLFLDVVDNYGTEQPWSNRPRQLWKFVDGGLLRNDEGKCLAGERRWLRRWRWYVKQVNCSDRIGKDGRWTYNSNTRQIKSDEGYCLKRGGDDGYIYYDDCKDDDPQQRWRYYH